MHLQRPTGKYLFIIKTKTNKWLACVVQCLYTCEWGKYVRPKSDLLSVLLERYVTT